jgi:protein-S-isoprenylcysteine O-methyltransferase Ste14
MNKQPWWKGARGEWYVVAQGVLFALVALGPRTWPGLPSWGQPMAGWSLWAGLALAGAGGLLGLAGLLHLGANLTPLPHPKDDATLVETGAYSVVRHPIYSGLIMAAFGWGLIVAGPFTLGYALILLIFFDVKSRREERWLAAKFPGYGAYQGRVKKLIPFVY